MRALLTLIVIGWLPGAIVFRAPLLQRDRRAALAAEERLYWAVLLSVTMSVTIVLALAAVHRYSLPRLLIADVAIAGTIGLISRFDLRLGTAAKWPGPAALLPIALLVIPESTSARGFKSRSAARSCCTIQLSRRFRPSRETSSFLPIGTSPTICHCGSWAFS
jgi:hypothetical protein